MYVSGRGNLNQRMTSFIFGCATRLLVPTRCPVLSLTRVAAVPGVLALRANFEVLPLAHNQGLTLVHFSDFCVSIFCEIRGV